ncbi:MAG: hypothetical protein H0Z35_13710 [Thermoanaerobacteraceae bacterium]|nr:hypothetical protein [Thermoanaerobacteraceae bacterium]
MDTEKFRIISDTLRQYRRADLTEFSMDGEGDLLDRLYTDPLPDNAVLKTVLTPNTTFLVGRKGTGKSTIFAKAQREIRKESKAISAYVDVKSLYDSVKQTPVNLSQLKEDINLTALQSHILRKAFLGAILSEIIGEVRKASENLNLFQRWTGQKSRYRELMESLAELQHSLTDQNLQQHELPILEVISKRHTASQEEKQTSTVAGSVKALASTLGPSIGVSGEMSKSDEVLTDEEIFQEYSEVLLRSFPFQEFIKQISELVENAGFRRVFVFLMIFQK